jgi:hypothetical protein
MKKLDVIAYLKLARGQTIAPLLLEVVMRSGKSYFLKEVLDTFDAEGLFAVRVWDMRALTDKDTKAVMDSLTAHHERDAWVKYRELQPKLDEANLWLNASDVEHIVEWHDKTWPISANAEEAGRPAMGFRNPGPLA